MALLGPPHRAVNVRRLYRWLTSAALIGAVTERAVAWRTRIPLPYFTAATAVGFHIEVID
jgi:hypothetical protein